ncbi:MAG: SDR family NAD(P)-dependent oxidoreductase [Phycisphaerales bacterium]
MNQLQDEPGPPAPLAIVTGGSGGIGFAIASALADRGYRLLIIGRSTDRLNVSLDRMNHQPSAPPHTAIACDFCDADGLAICIGKLDAMWAADPIHVLVNCAGVGLYRPFLETSADDFARLMQTNYFAAVTLIRAALPGMLRARQGHIINIASMSAKMGPWGHAAYSPTKAALASLTQTLAAEHAGSGVHFSVVNPGIVRTAYFENSSFASLWPRVKKYAIEPERVARAVVRLLDRPRVEVCVPRSHRLLDWITAIHPALTHRIVAQQSRPINDRTS